MSLSNAFSGFGTRLQMGDGGGPEVFTDVAEVVEVNPPGLTSDTIDVTHHLSPLAFREFIASLSSAGTISITVNYIPSNPTHDATTGLHAAAISKVRKNWKIILPFAGTPNTFSFAGIVTQFNVTSPLADRVTAAVVITVSGRPTLA